MLVSTEIVNLITEVGFPVSAFVMMFWFITRTQKDNTDTINKNTEALVELKTVIREKLK